jgi:pectate lyase-like protein
MRSVCLAIVLLLALARPARAQLVGGVTGQAVNVLSDPTVDPTGVVDSTAAIQAILTRNNWVYFPAGTYKITPPLKFSNNATVSGAGPRLVLLKSNAAGVSVLQSDDPTASRTGVSIHDLSIDNTSSANAGAIGINLKNVNASIVQNVFITNVEEGIHLEAVAYDTMILQATIRATVTGIRNVDVGEVVILGGSIVTSTTGLILGGTTHVFGTDISTFTTCASVTGGIVELIGIRCENAPSSGTGVTIGASVSGLLLQHPFFAVTTKLTDASGGKFFYTDFGGAIGAGSIPTGVNFEVLNNFKTYSRAYTGNGTPSSPAWSFVNDTGTGFYSIAAGQMGQTGVLVQTPVAFASLPACVSALEGSQGSVTDATTAVWGATITGSGANHVKAYCNGTAWTVLGK